MNITFNPDGNDLGRGDRINPFEFYTIVPIIAKIFQALVDVARLKNDKEYVPYKYAFEFNPEERSLILSIMNNYESKFTKDVMFYTIDSRKLFEMRGSSGGIVSSMICYLTTIISL